MQVIDGSGSFIGEIGSILVSCPCSLFISVSPWNTQENEQSWTIPSCSATSTFILHCEIKMNRYVGKADY